MRPPYVRGGMVVPADSPPIVPAAEAPTEIAQRPRYPRHGFGQEWPS